MNKLRFLIFAGLFFLCLQSFAQQSQIDAGKDVLAKAREMSKKLTDYQNAANEVFNKAITSINQIAYNSLPLAIPFGKNPVPADAPYELRLNSIAIMPSGAKADLYMRVDKSIFGFNDPAIQADKYLYMAADEVAFTRNGGFTGESNLILLGDFNIQISEGVTLKIFAINPNNQSVTHARFDCDGFVQLHLSAALEVSNKLALREDEQGNTTDKPFYVEFETDIKDLNNWLFEINNIPAFQFKSMPDFSIAINSLVYDKSMGINSPAMPKIEGLTEMWRGFYCKQATIKLPKYMRSKAKGTERSMIDVANLRIDESGFSGNFTLSNVFNDGQIGTWKYSLDEIKANFLNSKLKDFSASGYLEFPIAKQKNNISQFTYSAGFVGDKLTFYVQSTDQYDFSFLNAVNVNVINPSLLIEVNQNRDEFRGSFISNVNLSLVPKKNFSAANSSNPAPSGSLVNVSIEQLKITSFPPYIDANSLTISGATSKLSNFPLTITDPSISFSNGNIALGMNIGINFVGKGNNASSFGAKGRFDFYANRNIETNRWGFDRFEMSALCLKVESPGFDFEGCLQTFGEETPNQVYGEGFQAILKASFIKKINVNATALFGKTPDQVNIEGKKYWYVDAGVEFPAFPIFPGVGINGFYGGAYYNMSLCGPTDQCIPCTSSDIIGCNTSGIRFMPLKNSDAEVLGVRAGVGLVSMPTDAAFNGNVVLGMEFNMGGDNGFSVRKISFDGKVKFVNLSGDKDVSKMKALGNGASAEAETKCEDGIVVRWLTEYNVDERTLSGTFGVRASVAGVVKGTANPNICDAGNTELFFSEKDWYVWIGTPSAPLGFEIVGIFQTKSYFNMGSKLPNPPMMPLPNGFKVGVDNSSLANTGAGFALGFRAGANVSLRAQFGGKCNVWGAVNCGFDAGADILIAKQTRYEGLKTWHAKGQAFVKAYAGIEAGAECAGISYGVKLGAFEVGAALAAQAPNPTFISGEAYADFEVLGIVSGKFKFQFQYPNVPPAGIDPRDYSYNLIKKVYPSKQTDVISPYEGIQVTLSRGVGTTFDYQIPDLKEMNKQTSINIDVKKIDLKITSPTDNAVKFKTIINENKTGIAFIPETVMNPGKYKASVIVGLEFSSGGVKEEKYDIEFEVKGEDGTIPLNLVVEAYPLPKMQSFYKNTSSQGYIRLNTIPKAPVELQNGQEFIVRFTGKDSKVISEQKVIFNPNVGADNFVFNIPSADLNTSSAYNLKLIRRAAKPSSNTADAAKGITSGAVNPVANNEVVLLEYPFTTSRFATFESKIAALSLDKENLEPPKHLGLIAVPMLTTPKNKDAISTPAEIFDEDEVDGYFISDVQRSEPLVKIISDNCSENNKIYEPMVTFTANSNTFWFCKNVYDATLNKGSGKVGYFLPGRNDKAVATAVLNFNK